MKAEMKKTPSYLKGLAETRARVAAEVRRHTDFSGAVVRELDEPRVQTQRLAALSDSATRRLAAAKEELAACDRLIVKFDERLDPTLIEPIRAWKGRYGDRGRLKAVIVNYLREQAPGVVSTSEIFLVLQAEFGMQFINGKDKRVWLTNSVRPQLRDLVAEGLVEKPIDEDSLNVEVGRWRWRTDCALSLDHLKAQAEAAGVSVQQSGDVHA